MPVICVGLLYREINSNFIHHKEHKSRNTLVTICACEYVRVCLSFYENKEHAEKYTKQRYSDKFSPRVNLQKAVGRRSVSL